MKTLYVSDMDGTLLGSDSLVSPTSARIISDLTRRGALITVATARTAATVVPLLEHTLTTPPAIVMTGAAMWNRRAEAYDDVHFLNRDALAFMLDVCGSRGIHPFVYTLESQSFLRVYHGAEALNESEDAFYQARCHLSLKHFELGCRVPQQSRVMLSYAVGDSDRIFDAAEAIRGHRDLSMSCYYDIFSDRIAHLEIYAAGVSKASAIKRLKALTGADRVVVFGDNLNDLPMLREADLAVAVDNAFAEVKEAADRVIGPNVTDSVAKFIKEDFENQQA